MNTLETLEAAAWDAVRRWTEGEPEARDEAFRLLAALEAEIATRAEWEAKREGGAL